MNAIQNALPKLSDVLAKAQAAGVRFAEHEGNLKIRSSGKAIPGELLEQIKALKPEIIQSLKSSQSQSATQGTKLVHIDEKTPLPLTRLQESMWMAEKMSDSNGLLNYCCETELKGEIKIDALNYAYNKILERHLPLRSTFLEDELGRVTQFAEGSRKGEVDFVDLTPGEHEKDYQVFLKQCAAHQFNFQDDLLLHLHLVKRVDREYRLILVTHHLVTDGWSIGILFQELGFWYNNYLAGGTQLDPLQIDFFDYALWIEQDAQRQVERKGLEYWKQRLSAAPVLHNLPTDKSRPPVLSYQVDYLYSFYKNPALANLRSCAKEQGVTLYVLTLAVYVVFLHKYSGDKKFVIGTSVANRPDEKLEPLVGLFTNNLPMLIEYEESDTLESLVRRIQHSFYKDMEHQGVQLDRIIKSLDHDAMSPSYSPLIQNSFYLQNNEIPELDVSGLECKTREIKTGVSLYDFSLSISENESDLEMEWIYSIDLFQKDTVEQLAKQYTNMLEKLISTPAKTISDIDFIEMDERERILNVFSRNNAIEARVSATNRNAGESVFRLFEQRCNTQANSIAVEYEGRQMRYGELNSEANRLARVILGKLGHEQNSNAMVGVAIEKSIELVVTLLAIMKAGAAYVPLDPAFPAERLRYMQEVTKLDLVVGINETKIPFILPSERQLIWGSDELSSAMKGRDATNIDLAVSGKHLAYVLFTSGSTGIPKGVMIEHEKLSLFLQSMAIEPGLSAKDIMLAVSSISFDIHTLEIFLPLIQGAKLVLLSPSDYADTSKLKMHIDKQGISIAQGTPSVWKALVTSGWQPAQPIKVLCGGEALEEQLKDSLLDLGNVDLWNMYGPTEATVWCAVKHISEGQITLGRPTAGTRLYVLDTRNQIVPIGVAGQLFIGGQVLAKGYVDNKDLTNKAFCQIDNKLIAEERLYKTGDYVKWTRTGELVFLGRKDSQVKIRGFRIEPDEVQIAINNLEYVKDSSVVLRQGIKNDPLLAAYIVLNNSGEGVEEAIEDRIRRDLASVLPEYMMPSIIQPLSHLPLTPNGKVDREKLKKLGIHSKVKKRVAPATPLQHVLAELWCEVLSLGLDKISVHDNFYAVGGDSMSALVFVSRAKARGIDIKASDIIKAPTILALSEVCQFHNNVTEISPYNGPMALTIDQKSVLYHQTAREKYFINIVLDLKGPVDKAMLEKAMDWLVESHDALRSQFTCDEEGVWKNEIVSNYPGNRISEIHVESDEEYETAVSQLLAINHNKMQISCGPLMAASLLYDKSDRAKYVFSISHLICDGYSMPIALEDIFNCYSKLIKQNTLPSPRRFVATDEWGRSYDEYVRSHSTCEHVTYWENLPWKKLQQYPLDLNRSYSGNTVATARVVVQELGARHTDILLSPLLHESGLEQMDVLLAVLTEVIANWSNSEAVFFNVFDTGRTMVPAFNEDQDITRTLCSFAIARALFLRKSKASGVRARLDDLKKQIMAIPDKGFSYRVLLHSEENYAVHKKIKALPTPELWFNYFGVSDSISPENSDLPPISSISRMAEVVSMKDTMPRNRTLFLPWQVENGRLKMVWEYSNNLHHRSTIERLAEKSNQLLSKWLDELVMSKNINHIPTPENALAEGA